MPPALDVALLRPGVGAVRLRCAVVDPPGAAGPPRRRSTGSAATVSSALELAPNYRGLLSDEHPDLQARRYPGAL